VVRCEAKELGGCYCGKCENEKEGRKAAVFQIKGFLFSHRCDVRIGIKTSTSNIRVHVNSADCFDRQ